MDQPIVQQIPNKERIHPRDILALNGLLIIEVPHSSPLYVLVLVIEACTKVSTNYTLFDLVLTENLPNYPAMYIESACRPCV